MLVVADSSPLVVLAKIELINILPRLFGNVTIPPEVAEELVAVKFPEVVRSLITARPAWLEVKAPVALEPIEKLHPGELAAISLALELNADLILIDEIEGRKAAVSRNIRVTGTVGVLEWAATESFLDLAQSFDRLKATDFWISHDLLDARLKHFTEIQSQARAHQVKSPPSSREA